MAESKTQSIITPAECLDRLPEIPFELDTAGESDLRRAELRQSILAIVSLDHVSESALVRAAVKNALGHLPGSEE